MEKEANYFSVGVFVTLTLLAFVGFSIWLAGVHDFGHHRRYTIYFTDSVGGLSEEAAVRYKGVDVGKVLALRLARARNDLVKADIEVRDDTPIRAGTTASIGFQGITGQSDIELATANDDDKPPPTLPDEQYPVLKGTGSKLNKFFDELPQMGQQLETTLSAVDGLTREGSKAADSIKDLADKLKEDPSQILSSPSHKGVVIPK